jgi:hypothetical protein
MNIPAGTGQAGIFLQSINGLSVADRLATDDFPPVATDRMRRARPTVRCA